MASAAAIPGAIVPQCLALRKLKAVRIGPIPPFQQRRWRASVRAARAEMPRRGEAVAPVAAAVSAEPVVVEDKRREEAVNYQKIEVDLEHASPLEIMDRALEMFGDDIAIAFSEFEDVALIIIQGTFSGLQPEPRRDVALIINQGTFSGLQPELRRLNPGTCSFFDAVEKHCDIHIEAMFRDTAEVQTLERTKGLFSFYENEH